VAYYPTQFSDYKDIATKSRATAQKNRRSAALEAALTARQENQVEELVTVSLNGRVKRRLDIIEWSALFRIKHRIHQQRERKRERERDKSAFCHRF